MTEEYVPLAQAKKLEKQKAAESRQGQPLTFAKIEPWPESVNGYELLDSLVDVIKRHVVLPEHCPEATALWIVHAWTVDAADHSPILALTSPEKRCGKTTLLTLLARLVAKPLPSANVTPAALFRAITAAEPTLLIDEADSFLKGHEELRGLINSGHNREAAFLLRAEGKDFTPTQFRTWCPKVIALIGKLPDTLADRSIEIPLKRKRRDEEVFMLRKSRKETFSDLKRQCSRWTEDNKALLREHDISLPNELNDRAADNWDPLFKIADLASEEWLEKARRAAISLSSNCQDDSVNTQLLSDTKTVFEQHQATFLSSKDVAEELAEMEGRPWADWRGKPITPNAVARILKSYGIAPRQNREGTRKLRGYQLADFDDAFARYLPTQTGTTGTALKQNDFCGYSSGTESDFVPVEKTKDSKEINDVPVVPFETHVTSATDERSFALEERAAIMEHEAGLSREEAESAASIDIEEAIPWN